MSSGDERMAYRGPVLPLAHGELSEQDTLELRALKQLIRREVGLDCEGYKEKCLRRRIAVRMRSRGVHTYGAYTQLLGEDCAEFERLRDAITINVSKFFRNTEVWDLLRRHIVPALFALPDAEIRVWSAGTAGGEEAYSLAMLALEHAAAHGGDPHRFRITGTDIDSDSLAAAKRGEYGAFALTETSPEALSRWFDASASHRVKDEVRQLVHFEAQDLMGATFPASQHLILCRNVIIYFERHVQEALFRRFQQALLPGGVLVLGKVEALFGAAAHGFRPIAARERVFRRV